MSNRKYPKGSEGLLDQSIDLSGDVRVCLVKSSYVYDDAHEFMADIGTDDNGRSAAFTGQTFTGGVFDAADTSLVATDPDPCNALVLFQHTGSDATARLIGYIDTVSAGLAFTPAASQSVPITWSNGADKIFRI